MKLKDFRIKNGMTQEDVAAHLDIPKKTYQNYEREVREPSSDVLCALADLYETSIDEIVGRSVESEGTDPLEQLDEITSVYRSLSDKGRDALLAVAVALVGVFPRE